MAIGSVLNNGLAGVQQGYSKLNRASAEIARADQSSDPASDLARSAVDLLQGKAQVQASAKVLETANKSLGSLIDIEA